MTDQPSKILLSRNVVYFQAALLGVMSITCFLFGVMVGQMTSAPSNPATARQTALVSGRVVVGSGTHQKTDGQSVVVLLPAVGEPRQRLDATSIRPGSFVPLNNPTLDMIHERGGGVVRTLDDGSFRLVVDSPGSYWLVALSSQSRSGELDLTRQQVAAASRFFIPIESLFGEQRFFMTTLRVEGSQHDVGTIQIE